MQNEVKTLNGIMNLDDSNEVMPSTHHKEARNGVFKGNAPEMHFTAIRGNSKVNNTLLVANDCRLVGSTVFTPNCGLGGSALYIGKCDLVGTAIYVVNFNLSVTCALNDGVVVINGLTGGSGVYQISNAAYFTEASALAGNSYVDATSFTFNNMIDGVIWFVVRDKNNPSNKFAKSTTINCNGTSTECRVGFTVQIDAGGCDLYYQDCCGNGKNILYTTSGTFTVNDCTKVGSISTPGNGLISFTYLTNTCTANYTPNWVNEGSRICRDCKSVQPQKDTNQCSATYNTLRYVDEQVAAPCNYNAAYTEFAGVYYTCLSGSIIGRNVTRNTNTCFTGNQFFIQDTGISYTNNPANAFPSTEPNIQNQGYKVCQNCVEYFVFKDINECSGTYGKHYVNGTDYGFTAPIAMACNYEANYNILLEGSYYKCVNGVIQQYQIYQNSNAGNVNTCFSGAQWRTSDGLLWNFNPTNLITDLDPLWQNLPINEAYDCDYATFTMYYVQRDNNPLSCTYNQTRRGGVFETNSGTCGYTPPNNYRYSCIRCYTGGNSFIVSPVPLYEGATYSNTSSGAGECYSSITFFENTTDASTNYYLVSYSEDCGNASRCIQG
jgi:hypothetical protein